MSAATSTRDVGGPSYVATTHRRCISEPESPSISPLTRPASAPARSNRRQRPPIRPNSRARSDDVSGCSRFTVQTIDENQASQHNVSLSVESPPHKSRSSRNSAVTPASDGESQPKPRPKIISRRTSSSIASAKGNLRRHLLGSNPSPQWYNTTSSNPAKVAPTHERPHSESGDHRARAQAKSWKILSGRKTRSAENIARRRFRNSSDSARASLVTPTVPLRPPVSRNVSDQGPVHHHEIKLETPFTHSASPIIQEHEGSSKRRREPPSSRRSSSIRPKVIFSAPLNVIRRLRKHSNAKTAPARPRTLSPPASDTHGAMRGHVSQLRRKRTHEALRQVSQLLRLIAGDKPDAQPVELKPLNARTMSRKSTPSIKESRDGRTFSRKPTQDLPTVPVRIATQRSMDLDQRGSDSSSIRDFRLGPPPNATPEEQATYKLKRSPSAETEEFLKVDISIRGGTSYLPSEARRIHTPPLPSEGAGGKRRGFFFDYNAPGNLSVNEGRRKANELSEGRLYVAGEARLGTGGSNSNEKRPTSRQTVQSFDRGTYPTLRTGKKVRAVEWFDTKLAELDTSTDEDIPNNAKPKDTASSTFFEMRQRTARALHAMRNRDARALCQEEDGGEEKEEARKPSHESEKQDGEEEDEDEIDYNIPEHYPTSRLCPTNAKYWRFVDGKLGKGKYIRTCWMHGEMET